MTDHDTNITILIIIVFIAGLLGGASFMKSRYINEAIQRGVAHYVCDPKTGNVKFEWKK